MAGKQANKKWNRFILPLLLVGLAILPLLLCSPFVIRQEVETSAAVSEKIPAYREENPFADSASLETIRQYAEIVGDTPEDQLSEEQISQIEQLNLSKEEEAQCQESLSAVLDTVKKAEPQKKPLQFLWIGYGILFIAGIGVFSFRHHRRSTLSHR